MCACIYVHTYVYVHGGRERVISSLSRFIELRLSSCISYNIDRAPIQAAHKVLYSVSRCDLCLEYQVADHIPRLQRGQLNHL